MVVPFHLSLPPSINHCYVGIRRHKSKFYKEWLKESTAEMLLTVPNSRTAASKGDHWELTLTCVMPNWRRRDLDNTIKVLVDFLAEYLGLEDNRLVALAAVKEVVGGQSYCCGEVRIDGKD